MRWSEFTSACPEIAELARKRFVRDELVLLGTVTRDGWPRISPCELDFVGDELMMGMMWRSPKALDLLRGSPLVVHSVQADRHATDPDIKLMGRGVEVTDPPAREAYRDAIRARIDWAPEEPNFHVFALDVERAAVLSFADERETVTLWDPQSGLRARTKSGD
ncbi:MAG TPA: hypothetical protein VNN79_23840 [Actinomycetota bacterium]|nr:hypothetical protein [Actinomycetota bacterium]